MCNNLIEVENTTTEQQFKQMQPDHVQIYQKAPEIKQKMQQRMRNADKDSDNGVVSTNRMFKVSMV